MCVRANCQWQQQCRLIYQSKICRKKIKLQTNNNNVCINGVLMMMLLMIMFITHTHKKTIDFSQMTYRLNAYTAIDNLLKFLFLKFK